MVNNHAKLNSLKKFVFFLKLQETRDCIKILLYEQNVNPKY